MLGIWAPGVWTAQFASKLAGVSAVWLLMRLREGAFARA
jgi:hypothetical protein